MKTKFTICLIAIVSALSAQITNETYTLINGSGNIFNGTEGASGTISGGDCFFPCNNGGNLPNIYTRDNSFDDFELDISSWTTSNYTNAGHAIIWRYSGGNYYALTAQRRDGNYRFRIKENNTDPTNTTGQIGIYTGTSGAIKLTVDGDSIILEVGGVVRINISDSDYATGSIGFGNSVGGGAGAWSMDDVIFTDNSSPNPSVVTTGSNNVGCESFDALGEIESEGSDTIIERGVIYGTDSADVANATLSALLGTTSLAGSGTGVGTFTVSVSGLSNSTDYFFKTYAENDDNNEGYGEVLSFTTTGPCGPPTVTTGSALSIFSQGAQLSGNITSSGNLPVTKGFIYGDDETVVTNALIGSLGGASIETFALVEIATGVYTVDISGLVKDQVYYFKAYAINDQDTVYGSIESFTTLSGSFNYGSYVGDGLNERVLVGLGYDPAFFLIKHDGAYPGVMATSTMDSAYSKLGGSTDTLSVDYFGIIPNGIIVTDHQNVNDSGEVYNFLAWPASSDVAVGTYTGDGTSDGSNEVTGLGFEPVAIFVMGDVGGFPVGGVGDYIGMQLASRPGQGVHLGNATSRDIVFDITADGFQIGRHANASAGTYHYVAFGDALKRRQDSYTGTGAPLTVPLDSPSFEPQIVIATRHDNTPVYFRTATMTGTESFRIVNNSSSNSVTGLVANGFTAGNNGDFNSPGQDFSFLAFGDGELTVLPVELAFFNGKLLQDGSVKLNWQTLSEINSSYFYIQKSTDGVNFEIIGKVKAAGNSTEKIDYSFIDANPSNGNNYYRLVQVDIDGETEMFNTVLINSSNKFNLSNLNVFPNPASDFLTVGFNSTENSIFTLEIIDYRGRVVSTNNISVSAAYNEHRINTSIFSKGLYFLRIVTPDGFFMSEKFIKK